MDAFKDGILFAGQRVRECRVSLPVYYYRNKG